MSLKRALSSSALALAFLLAGCAGGGAGASDSVSSASTSSSLRPTVLSVLQKFAAHNGTNAVTYNYLSPSNDVSSVVAPTTPSLTALFVAQGFEFDFGGHWDQGRENFGYVTVPDPNPASAAPGLYAYRLDSAKKLVLGAKESGADEAYAGFGEYTPQYLYDHASRLAELFEPTARSEYNSINPSTSTKGAASADVDAVAKALSVYGILTAADPKITFHHVDLYYTATTNVYTFTFYVDYDGLYASGKSGAGVNDFPVGARAKLSAFGTTRIPAISGYLGLQ